MANPPDFFLDNQSGAELRAELNQFFQYIQENMPIADEVDSFITNLQTNKLNGNGTAVNSEKLGGQSPAAFASNQHSHSKDDLPIASTSEPGLVEILDSVTSASTSKAAAPNSVKQAMDKANSAKGRGDAAYDRGDAAFTKAEEIGDRVTAAMPAGAIIMWAGTTTQVPAGFQLCNGSGQTSNDIQIPDLRDRFVVGAGSSYDPGDTGGSNSKTTNTTGAHSHSVSVGNTTLSLHQIPSHNHAFNTGSHYANNNYAAIGNAAYGARGRTQHTGGSGSHSHSASSGSAGNHDHSVDVRPPYYALCYIIKL